MGYVRKCYDGEESVKTGQVGRPKMNQEKKEQKKQLKIARLARLAAAREAKKLAAAGSKSKGEE